MRNEYILFLTLGHNSSCIGMYNNKIIAGYEEERLDRKKASSAFPKKAIEKIFSIKEPGRNDVKRVYVSHWFDNFDFHEKYNEKIAKYWDYNYITHMKSIGFEIIPVDESFTHHDAHACSAEHFLNEYDKEQVFLNEYPSYTLVADGFGNNQEVLSIYRIDGNSGPCLVNRVYGYENSLGLLYQYATSYCGMKENQDEYKFLGYESRINEILGVDYYYIIYQAESYAKKLFKNINSTNKPKSTDFIDLKKLIEVKQNLYNLFHDIFNGAMKNVNRNCYNLPQECDEVEGYYKKIIIGTFIQAVIEKYHERLIDYYNIRNVALTGGLYYNVKLNNFILKNIEGKICVPPLAGDQGAAIGMVDYFPYSDLKWGVRDLYMIYEDFNEFSNYFHNKYSYEDIAKLYNNVKYFSKNEYDEFLKFIDNKLMYNNIVQVVTGDMEFGPRALCNTSTLALPRKENVALINKANGRDTVMPMAPVCTNVGLSELFDKSQYDRVIGSLEYMIVTIDYVPNSFYNKYMEHEGTMHNYPNFNNQNEHVYSGRPQLVHKGYIYDKLKRVESGEVYKALINTSYNAHGSPINYSVEDCLNDFAYQMTQLDEDEKSRFFLVFYNDKV